MDNFKEFQGKDLDECIKSACAYFNAPRETLEIEIIQDAKSGIFGIVLARKAKIRARRAQLSETARDMLGSQPLTKRPSRQPRPQGRPQERAEGEKPPRQDQKERGQAAIGRKKALTQSRPPAREPEIPEDGELDLEAEGLPFRPVEELDQEELQKKAKAIVEELLRPLADREINASLSLDHGSIHARVEWEGDAGLLIGREGQTLAALQYLASRMLSHAFNAALRVQLDIGDYRRKQDEKLRGLALNLAEKARQTGRPWSTRPLSSYHRRIIHMALQDAHDVQTRSSGDGPLKRVVISARRHVERP